MPKKDNSLPILTHILGLITGFLGPLIIFLATKNKETKKHAKIVLNWQFSLLIYMTISLILMLFLIGFLFTFILSIMNIVFSITGAVKASEGKLWKYPMSIKFFKIK